MKPHRPLLLVLACLAWLGLPACGEDEPKPELPDGQEETDGTDADVDATEPDADTTDDRDEQSQPDSDLEPDTELDLVEDGELDLDTEPDETEPDGDVVETDGVDGSDGDAFPDVDDDYEHDPALVELSGPCPLAKRVGGFKVEMNEDVGYTAVDGVIKDGVTPNQVYEEVAVEGDCKLLLRPRLVCDPSCEAGTTCGFAQSCVPMPLGQDAGLVTLQGLVQLVQLRPLQPGNTYFYTRLPHPGFAPDTVVRLSSTAGYFGALELYGVGVHPLVLAGDLWTLAEGQPLAIEWDVPSGELRSRIYLELNIDQHGLTPVNLVCDLPDTGSAAIPAAIIDALIARGVTGFPTARVQRRTVDAVEHDGFCADFMVSSVRAVDVEVTGYIPCTSDANCPPPTTCNLAIQQCQ